MKANSSSVRSGIIGEKNGICRPAGAGDFIARFGYKDFAPDEASWQTPLPKRLKCREWVGCKGQRFQFAPSGVYRIARPPEWV